MTAMTAITARYCRLTAFLPLLLMTPGAQAGHFSVDWDVIAGGGGISSGGRFTVQDTLGQLQTEAMSGSTLSVTAGFWALEVAPPVPSLTIVASSHLVQAGGDARFTVLAEYPYPLGYQWTCNGTNLADGPQIGGALSSQLLLTNITADLAGDYQVRVTGAFGSVTSAASSLAVNRPPVAGNATFYRAVNTALNIDLGVLLELCHDPDSGDTVSFVGVDSGQQGATTAVTNGFIQYVPRNNNSDTLVYTVRDNRGGSSRGAIAVEVLSSAGRGQAPEVSSSGPVTVRFATLPNLPCVVERSTKLDFSAGLRIWTTNAPGTGLFLITDDFSDLGRRPELAWYRLRFDAWYRQRYIP